jgi:predicted DNA-binding transcriptional regulator AlpA
MGVRTNRQRRRRGDGHKQKIATAVTVVGPPEPTALDRVVSEDAAAQILGYSKDTLRREFRAGKAPARVRLSAQRIGYRLSVLYSWLEQHTEQPGARAQA